MLFLLTPSGGGRAASVLRRPPRGGASQRCTRTIISSLRRNLLRTKPITYHMDSTTELHPLVEGHLMDARVQGEHNDPPLTILATFTIPAPISVAVSLRIFFCIVAQLRLWLLKGALVLSPKGRRFIYVAAYAENLELVSRDAKTATTIRQDERSFARSYQDSSRAEGSFCARPARVCAYEGGDSTVAGSWRYVRLFLC